MKTVGVELKSKDVIEETLKNPTHIYEDTLQKHLVYVCTPPYCNDRLVKVVIEPNFKSHGTVFNLAKSWGIVQYENMRGGQYRLVR